MCLCVASVATEQAQLVMEWERPDQALKLGTAMVFAFNMVVIER